MTVLSADSVGVRAADGTHLLSEISLSVDPGETVLICGPPGGGKTLLGKALKGLLDDRTDLAVGGTVRRRGSIGYVSQRPRTQLVRSTVRRDLAFGLENRAVPPEEIEIRVDDYADRLGLTALLDRPIDALSAGEATVVALLGVLVTEPDGVILDEPLSPLDARNTAIVLEAIDRLRAAGLAVVIAEHDVRPLLTRADTALLLRDGRAVATGAPRALLEPFVAAGVKLPFATEVGVHLGLPPDEVPLAASGHGAGSA